MSDSNVLVNFRLRDQPMRIKWMATDGVPGDGYKAQVTTIILSDGTRLGMDSSSILEQTHPDAAGGIGGYLVTFNGIVGFAADHPDRAIVDRLEDGEIDYELDFVHEQDERAAIEDQDFRIVERPRGTVTKLTARAAT
jgi:hypothetical protein